MKYREEISTENITWNKKERHGSGIRRMRGFLWSVALGILLWPLAGCKDDLVLEEGGADIVEEVDGDCIAFTMQIDKDMSSRADGDFSFSSDLDKYDNYIDTQDKFRVFFFSEKGDFLFGATDRIVSNLLNSSDNQTDYWYIRVPMNRLVDRDKQEYDIDKIKTYLKNNPFKVAVLANWPNADAKINPADWDDSEGSYNPSENPSSKVKGNPRWNWSNSILNTKANPADIRNINDLHHVYNDVYYSASTRLKYYQDYMANVNSGDAAGWYMGEPTDWVKMRDVQEGWKARYDMKDVNGNGGFADMAEANRWIRANWTPNIDKNQEKEIYRHYQHLWFLWNFDASFKTGLNGNPQYESDGTVASVTDGGYYESNWGWNDGSSAGPVNPWGEEWYKRNGDILYQWMKTGYNDGTNSRALGSKTIDVGESDNDVFFKYISRNSTPAYCVKVGDNYGIQLPAIGRNAVSNQSQGIITFQARTSGTLRVKWSSADETTSGLGVQVNNTLRIHDNVNSTKPVDWVNSNDNTRYWDISVEGDSEPVYIFCTSGKAVVYSIEFIRGQYLYATDREGILPNVDQGIPMYGVQDFPKIPDWQRGTTINISQKDESGIVRNIYLVRALAKVEVYIKKEFGEPKHVYMRNMNRVARCEPMDVHSATETYWNDQHEAGKCEWFDIIEHGPSYNVGDYAGWFSWLYGSWKQEGCYWKPAEGKSYTVNISKGYYEPDASQGGWRKGTFGYSTDLKSPHYFNPYQYRCNFCRFIQGEETEYKGTSYYKYVLYVPEKNITDPSSLDNSASTPRVPHIEYRFAPRKAKPDGTTQTESAFNNTEYNLDDNDCFRIYFTNYGYSDDSSLGDTEVNTYLKSGHWGRSNYDEYEMDRDRLRYHWPIMRNHKYKFYVGGTSPENPEIWIEVNEWQHRKVVVTW